MDAGDLVLANSKHPEGVLRAKGFLVGEREQRKVREFLEVIRVNALLIERTAVVRDVVVRVAKLVLRARGLQRNDFIAGGVLNAHLGAVVVREDIKRCGHASCLSFRGEGNTTPFKLPRKCCKKLVSWDNAQKYVNYLPFGWVSLVTYTTGRCGDRQHN